MRSVHHPASLHLGFALILVPVLAPLLVPGTAGAQAIEEIIVTAQKRAQNVTDVPIAVSAYSGEVLRDSGVKDIKDLTVLSPSLVVTSTQAESAGTTARIRGVGTTGDNLGLESSVAVFIDGVYRNRNNVALTELGEVERIEVLRGPQGTLFGKNASAGLINIVTRRPDPEAFSISADLSAGNYSYWKLGGALNAPIAGERLAFRLDASVQERDGFIDDVANGIEYNDRDRWLVRAQFTSQITDDLDLRLIADVSDRQETCCAAVSTIIGPAGGALALLGADLINPPRPFDRVMTSNANRGYNQDTEERGISAELNWETGIGTVTSITALRKWEAGRSQDIDYTNADILYRQDGTYQNDFDTFSQELRLAGQAGAVDWLVGLYYVDEELKYRDAIRVGNQYEAYANILLGGNFSEFTGIPDGSIFTGGQGVQSDNFRQEADSWAVFTHNIWNITDRWALTLGLRYTEEDKDYTANLDAVNNACPAALNQINLGNVPAPAIPTLLLAACLPLVNPFVDGTYSDSRTDEEVTGIVSLSYDLTESWLAYASYSRGYKAGGYNLDRGGLQFNPLLAIFPDATDLEFDAETVDSYEVGAKGYLLDETLQLSIALFRSEFEDFQLNTFNGANFLVSNVSGVTSQGVELEALWRVTEGLTLQGGATYTDATYDSDVVTDDPNAVPLAGKRLTNAPRWIATAAATYERPVTDTLVGFISGNYRFMSEVNTGSDLDPQKRQASYAVWNGRLGVKSDDDRWSAELWALNLFDKDYRQVVIDSPLQPGSWSAFLGDPRTWGATVRYKFQ